MSQKIAITPRSLSSDGHPALTILETKGYELVYPSPGKTPSEAELLATLPDCVGWLAGVESVSDKVLEQSPGLKVISRNGVGVNNIPLLTAEGQGIAVQRAVGANARGVAELAITLMMSAFRNVTWSHGHLSTGNWQRRVGIEAQGRTLGLVGCGAIGRTVAELASGIGMNVLGYDPYPIKGFDLKNFRQVELAEVLSNSDAISLHCPPSEQPIIDANAVARMRPGTVVLNTARAELVCDDAILGGLESGQISSYATDVFVSEPPEMTPLLSHERTILTPHIGGFSVESVDRATRVAVENILEILER